MCVLFQSRADLITEENALAKLVGYRKCFVIVTNLPGKTTDRTILSIITFREGIESVFSGLIPDLVERHETLRKLFEPHR